MISFIKSRIDYLYLYGDARAYLGITHVQIGDICVPASVKWKCDISIYIYIYISINKSPDLPKYFGVCKLPPHQLLCDLKLCYLIHAPYLYYLHRATNADEKSMLRRQRRLGQTKKNKNQFCLYMMVNSHWLAHSLTDWAKVRVKKACKNNIGNENERRMEAWASYQIRNIAGCPCAGNAGNVFPRCRLQRKPLASDPGMHAVMHVWIACLRWRGTRSRHSRRMRTRNFPYLARGPWKGSNKPYCNESYSSIHS